MAISFAISFALLNYNKTLPLRIPFTQHVFGLENSDNFFFIFGYFFCIEFYISKFISILLHF